MLTFFSDQITSHWYVRLLFMWPNRISHCFVLRAGYAVGFRIGSSLHLESEESGKLRDKLNLSTESIVETYAI